MATKLHTLQKIYPWIKTPLIISAPMRIFAGPKLAVATHDAGGIGFLGPPASASSLHPMLQEARGLLKLPPDAVLPIGIGFQTFSASLKEAIPAIKNNKPIAVWLFAPGNGQEELDEWSREIKNALPETQIWIQIGSVSQALAAARSLYRPDVLVVQGIDAGGHGLARGAGVISLLPEIADALEDPSKVPIPLVAAGGIADGRGVASALCLGAVGAVMGTRFLAAEEAIISKGYQADVLRTVDGGQNTVRTKLYDELAGRTDWPEEYDGRNVLNGSFRDHQAGLSFNENKKNYTEALSKGDSGWGPNGRLTAYIGSGVGLVRKVETVEEIVTKSRQEAISCVQGALALN